ncbi:MAG: U32 family peptidase [Ruminococcaceae bacterium]|nr:U32 family peptidase [Oscillospiraceae bacterium]
MTKKFLPELLSPAGSKEAFMAAVDGGADAIYVGGTSFNARINAKNFTSEELSECVKLAHSYGVKVYVTLNTLLFDREKEGFLSCAENAATCGVDAFIVADMGAAELLRSHMPDMPLHASTQMSAHNAGAGIQLQKMGFSRLVPARELSFEDIKYLVDNNPLEVEIFTHGALCVSHSGQCLFSSMVGGRSGNRGLCAQPCRLPYCASSSSCPSQYPLSLKDLSLATHVTEILDSGVHSLKIEGRMKAPEYVHAVTGIWRRLLDEGRNASGEEMKKLADIFSRGGFTDGYFTKNINKKMLGIRSEADKSASMSAEKFTKINRKLPIDIDVDIHRDSPCRLKISFGDLMVSAEGDIPQTAINAPIDEDCVQKSMLKLGDTPFIVNKISISLDNGLMLPVSRLNSLRRSGIDKLLSELTTKQIPKFTNKFPAPPSKERKKQRIGRFLFPSQITDKAKKFFDKTFLPLERYDSSADGFVLPPVIFDSEKDAVMRLINSAIKNGATCAMVGNIGNIELVRDLGIDIFGDFRFNVTNSLSVAKLNSIGVTNVTLSPELTLPQTRDISGDCATVVYGRIPLMTLEKCIIRDTHGCEACEKFSREQENGNMRFAQIKDRRGFIFPVAREWQHRNVIYNSMPTCMSDKPDELSKANVTNQVFMFTTETPQQVDQVIHAYIKKIPLEGSTRRI